MGAARTICLTSIIASTLVTGCSRSSAPKARLAGEVAALGGVAGIIASTLATSAWSHAKQSIAVFAVVTGAGLVTYAVGELTDPAADDPPADPVTETLPQRNRRWAKILTARAAGAARDGRCLRVHRLEPRVRDYDPEVHDFLFMRDPEIVRCLAIAPAPGNPSAEAAPLVRPHSPPPPPPPIAPANPSAEPR